MKNSAFHVLRVGTAITFLWIAVLILKEPETWGSFLQPWAAGLLPIPIREAMIGTAILDFVIGFFLLIDVYTFFFSVLGLFHLITVLIVVGIDAITVRDIGLAAGTLALVFDSWPKKQKPR